MNTLQFTRTTADGTDRIVQWNAVKVSGWNPGRRFSRSFECVAATIFLPGNLALQLVVVKQKLSQRLHEGEKFLFLSCTFPEVTSDRYLVVDVAHDKETPIPNPGEWTVIKTSLRPRFARFSLRFKNRNGGRPSNRFFTLVLNGRTLFEVLSELEPSDTHTIDLPAQFVADMLAGKRE